MHCDILTWTSVTKGTVFRGIVATNAGVTLVALENGVTLVRGAIIAFLEAKRRQSRAARLSDGASGWVFANRRAVSSNVSELCGTEVLR